MEKNQVLILSEVIYHISACRDLDTLKQTILSQARFLLPYSYASLMDATIDPENKGVSFHHPVCLPEAFTETEQAWIQNADQSPVAWIVHTTESRILRQSDVLSCQGWFDTPLYRALYQPHNICDMMILNITTQERPMALLCLFRTMADGPFTPEDAFLLRLLSSHINLAYDRCLQTIPIQEKMAHRARTRQSLGLTRREEEVLDLVFQDLNNEEIVARLVISRGTLLKHLQNIYRKCDVSSRVDLLKLREDLQ